MSSIFSDKKDESPSSKPVTDDTNRSGESVGTGSFIWEIVKFTLLALVIVVPIRMFVAQPFIVSGSSMDTTFASGQYVIVDQLSYQFHSPARGDVIIFRYPKDPSKFFIKRIIGLPSETLSIAGDKVTIKNTAHPEGFTLSEPYVSSPFSDDLTTTLGPTEYFAMGDNRAASLDSRIWGPLPEKNIIGRAFVRLLPVTEAAVLPGEYRQTQENPALK